MTPAMQPRASCLNRSMLLATAMVIAGCGRGQPRGREPMCRAIFAERTTGIIKPFRDYGPEHENQFMALCVTLPDEYLVCELEPANRQSAGCARMLLESPHARRLNAVLVSGRGDGAIPSAGGTPTLSPRGAGAPPARR